MTTAYRLLSKIKNVIRFLFVLLLLFGCTSENYPKDWASRPSSFLSIITNEGCPDIQGTWDVKQKDLPNGAKSDGMWPLFGIIDRNSAQQYETLTITGDSRTHLTLRLERSVSSILNQIQEERKMQLDKGDKYLTIQKTFLERMDPKVRTSPPFDSMTDEEYAADMKNRYPFYQKQVLEKVAMRGSEYRCQGGYLIELYTNDPKISPGTTFKVGLNKDHDLIRSGERTDESYFSFWCGDHCDNSIRLPDVHHQWWDRKQTTAPIVNPPPTWKVASFKPVPKPPVEQPKPPVIPFTKAEIQDVVTKYLRPEISLKDLKESGVNWVATIECKNQSAVSQFLFSLDQDQRLSKSELIEAVGPGKLNIVVAKVLIKKAN